MIQQEWTGKEARALRQAIRMSVRAWADHLGVSTRAVSKWERLGAEIVPRPHMQAILDTALAQVDADTEQRFQALLDSAEPKGQ